MVLKNWYNILLFSVVVNLGWAQSSVVRCIDPEFDSKVEEYVSHSVPLISVADAYPNKENYIFLDARELDEYIVSHIEDAIYIGYSDFAFDNLNGIEKNSPIIIYCSIGYRSDKIGSQLLRAGYKNVSNLYGSIFEWVNQQHPVYNVSKEKTARVHTYNKKWSKWISNDEVEKVY